MRRSSVAGMFRANVADHGDKPMFRFNGTTVTWAEHYARACRVAQALQAEGVGARRPGGVPRPQRARVLRGALRRGARRRRQRGRQLAPRPGRDGGGDRRLPGHGPRGPPRVRAVPGRRWRAGCRRCGGWWCSGTPRPTPTSAGASDLARRVGYEDWLGRSTRHRPRLRGSRPTTCRCSSTRRARRGCPKGVMLANRNIEVMLELAAGDAFEIGEDTVSLVAMPLFHIGGSGWALSGMSRGGTSVILRDMDPAELLRLVERRADHPRLPRARRADGAAGHARRSRETDLSSLDTIFYGASPIAEDVLVRCLEVFGCRFAQVYGMTETTGAIVRLAHEDHDPGGPRRHLLRAAGKPLAGVELRIVDPDTGGERRPDRGGRGADPVGVQHARLLGQARRDGAHHRSTTGGCAPATPATSTTRATCSSTTASRTWWSRAGRTSTRPRSRTCSGHARRGRRRGHRGPRRQVGRDGEGDRRGRAPGTGLDADAIIAFCRERLAHYKCPTSVDFVAALPRNPSGKVLEARAARAVLAVTPAPDPLTDAGAGLIAVPGRRHRRRSTPTPSSSRCSPRPRAGPTPTRTTPASGSTRPSSARRWAAGSSRASPTASRCCGRRTSARARPGRHRDGAHGPLGHPGRGDRRVPRVLRASPVDADAQPARPHPPARPGGAGLHAQHRRGPAPPRRGAVRRAPRHHGRARNRRCQRRRHGRARLPPARGGHRRAARGARCRTVTSSRTWCGPPPASSSRCRPSRTSGAPSRRG